MRIIELQWNDRDVEHIALHDVNPKEVEDICFGKHLSRKENDQRYVLSGQTAVGRYLDVVVEQLGKGLFRTITAFEMSENYKRKYRKRIKRG